MEETTPKTEDAVYEKVAKELEEKCKQRHAHDFYAKLRKSPSLCRKLNEIANRRKSKIAKFSQTDMDLAHMQTMALDFFQTLDEELSESVWRVLEDTENTTLHVKKPSEKGGSNFVGVIEETKRWGSSSRTLKKMKVEISLQPRNDTLGLVDVAHELAHTMEEHVQKRKIQKIGALGEIVPLFMEKIYADHLVKIGKIDQEERERLRAFDENVFINNARTIMEEAEIFEQLSSPITANDLKALDEKYAGSPQRATLLKRIKTMIDEHDGMGHFGERQFRYIIGQIVSEELYKDYQKDPQKTIEKVKSFAQNSASISAQAGFGMLLGEDYEKRIGMKIGKSKSLKD